MLETLARLLGTTVDSAEFALFLSTLPLLGADWEHQIDRALSARTPALARFEILRLTRRCVALVSHKETLASGRAAQLLASRSAPLLPECLTTAPDTTSLPDGPWATAKSQRLYHKGGANRATSTLPAVWQTPPEERKADHASAALAFDHRNDVSCQREAWRGDPTVLTCHFAPRSGVRPGTDAMAVSAMSAVSRRASVDGPKQALEAGHEACQAIAAHCIITVQAMGGRGITPTFEAKVTALKKTRRGGRKHRK